MAKTKQLSVPTNGTATRHKLPKALIERIQAERQYIQKQVDDLRQREANILNLLKDGFAASLDTSKKYEFADNCTLLIEK